MTENEIHAMFAQEFRGAVSAHLRRRLEKAGVPEPTIEKALSEVETWGTDADTQYRSFAARGAASGRPEHELRRELRAGIERATAKNPAYLDELAVLGVAAAEQAEEEEEGPRIHWEWR